MNKKPLVYIMGPYTKGDHLYNVHQAMELADRVVESGGIPYIPHLSHFWHCKTERDWEFWMDYDEVFLRLCQFAIRVPGESTGADQEEVLCKKLGIRVIKDPSWLEK